MNDYIRFTHQVNYSQRFTSGPLKGKLYHNHLRFTSRADAAAFAKREGQEVIPCAGEWRYIVEDAQVINLRDYE